MTDSERSPQEQSTIWPEQMTRWLNHLVPNAAASAARRDAKTARLAEEPPRRRDKD